MSLLLISLSLTSKESYEFTYLSKTAREKPEPQLLGNDYQYFLYDHKKNPQNTRNSKIFYNPNSISLPVHSFNPR